MDVDYSSVIRIATVEDSPIVADRLRSMLGDMPFVQYTGNATNVEDALQLIQVQQPDLVILDIHLRDDSRVKSGMDLIPAFREAYPAMSILMFTNFSDRQYRDKCIALGADFFFDKTNEIDMILETVQQIHEGRQAGSASDQTQTAKPQPATQTATATDGRISTASGITIDRETLIAIEQRYEAALAQQEAVIDAMASKIQTLTAGLEEAHRQTEAFSYTVSHDLKAPLRIISGYSHILLQDYATALDMEGKEYLRVINNNTVKMGRLIDGILRFSRLDKTAPEKEYVDMNDLVADVITEVQKMNAKSNTKINVGKLQPAVCDPTLMRQVWANLISNAVKYSSLREQPQVEIGMMAESMDGTYFVRDNGIGFHMTQAERLFAPFQRLDSALGFEGSGVGLATVHRIVQRHEGRVWAEAAEGEGASFYFAIPAVS